MDIVNPILSGSTIVSGSLTYTAGSSVSASYAVTSSFSDGTLSASFADNATSASFANNAITSSFNITSSNGNSNSGSITWWLGTQAEFNAISESTDLGKVYFII